MSTNWDDIVAAATATRITKADGKPESVHDATQRFLKTERGREMWRSYNEAEDAKTPADLAKEQIVKSAERIRAEHGFQISSGDALRHAVAQDQLAALHAGVSGSMIEKELGTAERGADTWDAIMAGAQEIVVKSAGEVDIFEAVKRFRQTPEGRRLHEQYVSELGA